MLLLGLAELGVVFGPGNQAPLLYWSQDWHLPLIHLRLLSIPPLWLNKQRQVWQCGKGRLVIMLVSEPACREDTTLRRNKLQSAPDFCPSPVVIMKDHDRFPNFCRLPCGFPTRSGSAPDIHLVTRALRYVNVFLGIFSYAGKMAGSTRVWI